MSEGMFNVCIVYVMTSNWEVQ